MISNQKHARSVQVNGWEGDVPAEPRWLENSALDYGSAGASPSRLNLFRHLIFAALTVTLLVCPACATLQADRDALARYERTREDLERSARGETAISYEEAARNKKQPLAWSDLSPTNWKETWGKLLGRAPSSEEAERLFREGDGLYAEGLQLREQHHRQQAGATLLAAAGKFEAAAKRLPKSTLEQNSLYFAGESYFFADYFVKANESYEKLLKEHPNSRYLDDVQRRRFAIAQYWLDLYRANRPYFYEVNLVDSSRPWNGLFTNAMRIFDRVRLDDPTGKLADDATLALANAHFAEGSFSKADEYYTDLRKTFPSSEHQFTAHFVGLKAKMLCYQGPDYGGAVLDESEKLIDTIRKQFPIEAQQEREYLVRALAEVRFRKAEREWLTAQYFDRKAEYGAAKFYYATIMKDFNDTPFADKTRERLVQIGELPNVPAQRFEWLVDIFPREEKTRPLIATDRPKTKKR